MSDWIIVTDHLPDLDQVVELAVVSGYDGRLHREFGCRTECEDGWLWALGDLRGVPEDAMECEADDDYPVYAWREPTPLPAAPPHGFDHSPHMIDPPDHGP